MTLATFGSKEEASFFNSKAGIDVWVGVGDILNEGSFAQVDGEPTPQLPWANGMPDDFSSNENCVQSGWLGSFNDNNCMKVIKFSCQTKEMIA
jgi:Lectin C-type domain